MPIPRTIHQMGCVCDCGCWYGCGCGCGQRPGGGRDAAPNAGGRHGTRSQRLVAATGSAVPRLLLPRRQPVGPGAVAAAGTWGGKALHHNNNKLNNSRKDWYERFEPTDSSTDSPHTRRTPDRIQASKCVRTWYLYEIINWYVNSITRANRRSANNFFTFFRSFFTDSTQNTPKMTDIDQNHWSNFSNLLGVSFYVYGITLHLFNSSKSAGIVKRTSHSKKGQGPKNINILLRYYN